MTLKEFKEQLKQLKQEGWKFVYQYGRIRLKSPLPEDDRDYCPITAVYFDLRNDYVFPAEYGNAARQLGLRPQTGTSIVYTADHEGYYAEIVRHSNFKPGLRKFLENSINEG